MLIGDFDARFRRELVRIRYVECSDMNISEFGTAGTVFYPFAFKKEIGAVTIYATTPHYALYIPPPLRAILKHGTYTITKLEPSTLLMWSMATLRYGTIPTTSMNITRNHNIKIGTTNFIIEDTSLPRLLPVFLL